MKTSALRTLILLSEKRKNLIKKKSIEFLNLPKYYLSSSNYINIIFKTIRYYNEKFKRIKKHSATISLIETSLEKKINYQRFLFNKSEDSSIQQQKHDLRRTTMNNLNHAFHPDLP